jgi:hypothetical protein
MAWNFDASKYANKYNSNNNTTTNTPKAEEPKPAAESTPKPASTEQPVEAPKMENTAPKPAYSKNEIDSVKKMGLNEDDLDEADKTVKKPVWSKEQLETMKMLGLTEDDLIVNDEPKKEEEIKKPKKEEEIKKPEIKKPKKYEKMEYYGYDDETDEPTEIDSNKELIKYHNIIADNQPGLKKYFEGNLLKNGTYLDTIDFLTRLSKNDPIAKRDFNIVKNQLNGKDEEGDIEDLSDYFTSLLKVEIDSKIKNPEIRQQQLDLMDDLKNSYDIDSSDLFADMDAFKELMQDLQYGLHRKKK